MNYKTKNCIVCEKKAMKYCGHVLEDREGILAGWCSEHLEILKFELCPNLLNREGCYGGYHEKYGKEEDI